MDLIKYITEKIESSPVTNYPFEYLQIDNFLPSAIFKKLHDSLKVNIKASDDPSLVRRLLDEGYRSIAFPGCVADIDHYFNWRSSGKPMDLVVNNTSCESFGVVFRLVSDFDDITGEIIQAFNDEVFIEALCKKFGVSAANCEIDIGMQKYLDGYEISPHPDIRRKALTFMYNINPYQGSEKEELHTHLLRFKDQYSYIERFWNKNPDIERAWVPWDWCKTVHIHSPRNSLIVFAPNDQSLHAVRASYDHLKFQRTQMYGNLWRLDSEQSSPSEWEQLDLISSHSKPLRKNSHTAKSGDSNDSRIHRVKFRK